MAEAARAAMDSGNAHETTHESSKLQNSPNREKKRNEKDKKQKEKEKREKRKEEKEKEEKKMKRIWRRHCAGRSLRYAEWDPNEIELIQKHQVPNCNFSSPPFYSVPFCSVLFRGLIAGSSMQLVLEFNSH